MSKKKAAILDVGVPVKISKRSHVIDRDRAQEGLPAEKRTPIEVEVTGRSGIIDGDPYFSPSKKEVCHPVRLASGAIIGVPESRLEPRTSSARIGYSRAFERGHHRIFGNRKRRK